MTSHRHRNRLAGLLALLALPLLLAACGGGIPGNAIATVDGEAITKKSYERWGSLIVKMPQGPGMPGDPKAVVPDTPDFKKCVAAAKAKLPKPAKGKPAPPDTALKQGCEAGRDSIVSLLIMMDWLEAEADKEDVKPSKEELDKAYKEFTQQPAPQQGMPPQPGAPPAADPWKQAGATEEEMRTISELTTLQKKLVDKRTKKVDDAYMQEFYNKNPERFERPETRDISIVRTKTKAQAEAAKKAIDGGEKFEAVAKRVSTDASKDNGGKIAGVAKGQQEKALDEAVFSAKPGQVKGPVETQFGWYTVRVDKVVPPEKMKLDDKIKPILKQQLEAENQQKAQESFGKAMEAWKKKTDCAPGYKIELCSNGPKPSPTPAAPPPQGGGGAQQAPPPEQGGEAGGGQPGGSSDAG